MKPAILFEALQLRNGMKIQQLFCSLKKAYYKFLKLSLQITYVELVLKLIYCKFEVGLLKEKETFPVSVRKILCLRIIKQL